MLYTVCRVDTDVVILTIAMYSQINPNELCTWLAFASKLHFSNIYVPIHEVVRGLIYQCAKSCQFSMHLLVVLQFQHLEEEGKRQPGMRRKYFLKSPKHLNT